MLFNLANSFNFNIIIRNHYDSHQESNSALTTLDLQVLTNAATNNSRIDLKSIQNCCFAYALQCKFTASATSLLRLSVPRNMRGPRSGTSVLTSLPAEVSLDLPSRLMVSLASLSARLPARAASTEALTAPSMSRSVIVPPLTHRGQSDETL